jgi:hypothetical protein
MIATPFVLHQASIPTARTTIPIDAVVIVVIITAIVVIVIYYIMIVRLLQYLSTGTATGATTTARQMHSSIRRKFSLLLMVVVIRGILIFWRNFDGFFFNEYKVKNKLFTHYTIYFVSSTLFFVYRSTFD